MPTTAKLPAVAGLRVTARIRPGRQVFGTVIEVKGAGAIIQPDGETRPDYFIWIRDYMTCGWDAVPPKT